MRRVFYEGRPQNDGQLYWFQDNRTGCEKQTVYFERIRQLESELITKEQKHFSECVGTFKTTEIPQTKACCTGQKLGTRADVSAKIEK